MRAWISQAGVLWAVLCGSARACSSAGGLSSSAGGLSSSAGGDPCARPEAQAPAGSGFPPDTSQRSLRQGRFVGVNSALPSRLPLAQGLPLSLPAWVCRQVALGLGTPAPARTAHPRPRRLGSPGGLALCANTDTPKGELHFTPQSQAVRGLFLESRCWLDKQIKPVPEIGGGGLPRGR